jgi:hypothetical protein
MRNKVVEISMNDIEHLITDFVSEEQRWSQSVREEVKYGDMNPESDRDYIIDELWIKNTAGTVVTMPYGDMITFNSSRHFFRGENQIYPSSIPSLNRKLISIIGYDVNATATRRFFSTVQNKLHWAIHGHTAAEVIYKHADAEKKHMGLTSWKDAPNGNIQKFDVSVAKNYLSESEMAQLQRLVSAYLDIAEDMALRHIPINKQIRNLR